MGENKAEAAAYNENEWKAKKANNKQHEERAAAQPSIRNKRHRSNEMLQCRRSVLEMQKRLKD